MTLLKYLFSFFIAMFLAIPVTIACTIVSAAKNGEVFAAANEDDYIPFMRIWFNPATRARYGSVCFGSTDLQIGAAMNEHGLMYDFTAQSIDVAKLNQKNPDHTDFMFEILGKCKTVPEALAWLNGREMPYSSQVLLADAVGNSVIINPMGHVVKTTSFQVNTNFNIFDAAGHNYNCRRFDIANQLLANATTLDVPLFRNILERTHQEGDLSTQYSAIYDLKRGIVRVYLFHNFQQEYRFDLKKELKNGYRMQNLRDYFTPSFAFEKVVKSHSLFMKEQILKSFYAGNSPGTGIAIIDTARAFANTLSNVGADSAFTFSLLEVSLQLIKDAYNQHYHGSVWPYWFNFDNAYSLKPFRDDRLTASAILLRALRDRPLMDRYYKSFIDEMLGYLAVAEGNKVEAKRIYSSLISIPESCYPITLLRSQRMLKAF